MFASETKYSSWHIWTLTWLHHCLHALQIFHKLGNLIVNHVVKWKQVNRIKAEWETWWGFDDELNRETVLMLLHVNTLSALLDWPECKSSNLVSVQVNSEWNVTSAPPVQLSCCRCVTESESALWPLNTWTNTRKEFDSLLSMFRCKFT